MIILKNGAEAEISDIDVLQYICKDRGGKISFKNDYYCLKTLLSHSVGFSISVHQILKLHIWGIC